MRRLDRRRLRYIRDIVRQGPTETGYAYFRARRRRRNIADDELQLLDSDRIALESRLDVTERELEANAGILRGYEEMEALDLRRIHWLVPAFENVHQGGIHTILRFADHARRVHGADSSFSIVDSDDSKSATAIQGRIGAAFPALAGSTVIPASREPAPCDVAFATTWTSIYRLVRFSRTRAKLVFVQDWEPDFQPAGSASALMREAARFGFPGVVNTPALADEWRRAGNPAVSFLPAVDTARFRPPDAPRPKEPVRIFFYGRPWNSRNAFGLGLMSLRLVKERFGERVQIVSAGEGWSPGQYGAADVLENRGLIEDLDAVAELYRSCHIGLVFMLTKHPSYQPLEFMASGMATVTNENAYTSWLLRHEETALLSRPIPSFVAEQLGRLVEDAELRERLAAAGPSQVREVRWKDQLERIWGALTKRGPAFTTEPELGEILTAVPRSSAPRG
jgi:O-antigen biosynthesis protein